MASRPNEKSAALGLDFFEVAQRYQLRRMSFDVRICNRIDVVGLFERGDHVKTTCSHWREWMSQEGIRKLTNLSIDAEGLLDNIRCHDVPTLETQVTAALVYISSVAGVFYDPFPGGWLITRPMRGKPLPREIHQGTTIFRIDEATLLQVAISREKTNLFI